MTGEGRSGGTGLEFLLTDSAVVTVFDLTNRDTIRLQEEENRLHGEERLYTPRFHCNEVGLRNRQLYPDSLCLLLQSVMEVLLDSRRQGKLLILYLLIGNVAAQCSKPEAGENMVLTEESLLKNDFPEGSEVTLACSNGYEKKSGSGIMNCIDNKWTEPDLNCKKKDCGIPKAEPHMKIDISQGTLFGSIVKVTCEEGYQINGSSYKHCLPKGWFGKASCNIVTCSKPTEIENGEHSWSSDNKPKYQETIYFTCKPGYTMLGNQSIQCTKTGKYNSEPPQCIGLTREGNITTNIITTAPTTTGQETSTGNGLTATPTFHKVTTVTASTNISTLKQGYRIRPSEENNTTPSTSKKEQNIETININKDKGHTAVIISVVVVTTVLCLVAFFLNKFLMRKKGSVGNGAVC
ncbi:complement decay-accelerating factor-like [Poeciliopsis prolifica]|uniref:complement decay-accelerating factor-like n=1 Tax=Poeciliopsis prolifica TaxID=188132 RepID=UPI0024137B4D|nr:complement decay-accelerating factor-like [Poeciliopsis prolifica]